MDYSSLRGLNNYGPPDSTSGPAREPYESHRFAARHLQFPVVSELASSKQTVVSLPAGLKCRFHVPLPNRLIEAVGHDPFSV